MKFEVIFNPQRILFKHEVWYSGKLETSDSRGYLNIVDGVRLVKSFMSDEAAKGFIQYQTAVNSFRGDSNIVGGGV